MGSESALFDVESGGGRDCLFLFFDEEIHLGVAWVFGSGVGGGSGGSVAGGAGGVGFVGADGVGGIGGVVGGGI